MLDERLLPLVTMVVAESELPSRDRQVVILRICALTGEVYEAAHHELISHTADLSDDEIETARTEAGLSSVHQLLACAAEELVHDFTISDRTWAALAEHYPDTEMVQFVALLVAYSASKGGIFSFSRALAPEGEAYGIKETIPANGICGNTTRPSVSRW